MNVLLTQIKIEAKLKKYSQYIINNDNDYDNDLCVSSHFICFFFLFKFFANCKWYESNEWFTLTALIRGLLSVLRICAYNHENLFPLFQSFSCWFYPAHFPRHDMIAMWIEDRCEMVGKKKENEMKMKWKRNKRMKQFAKWTKHWKMARKSTTVGWAGEGVAGRVYKGCAS